LSFGSSRWLASVFVAVFLACGVPCAAQNSPSRVVSILNYIHSNWDQLTRSMDRCDSVTDPKLSEIPVLYLPADYAEPESVKKLEATCKVRVQHLPTRIKEPGQADPDAIRPSGLLYLPNAYVVPGGRFNEMYGWDSYFILLGLLEDKRVDLARGMVENFFFEIEHYGTVLNANRTYYLTRSQPPFLTSMIMSVYQAQKDHAWLERAYSLAKQDHDMWTREPHLAGSTGLSRYYDFGTGPAPESLQDEAGLRRKVVGYFLLHPEQDHGFLVRAGNATKTVGPDYTLQICGDSTANANPACDSAGPVSLSGEYYKGDRSMRESGFDVSFRFEPFGAATHHYAPVCLNTLLYKTEKDLAKMAQELGRSADAANWERAATRRKELINRYLWDEARGLYFDYNFESGKRSSYEFVTTFYPLWAGLANQSQFRAVLRNLKDFEQAGGLATSTNNSGAQWDYPYGWAPLQLLAIEGMRQSGDQLDADRISCKFLSTVMDNFQREGTIREKYNVVTRSSEAPVTAGYKANVIGFGWTNGVFVRLLQDRPEEMAKCLENPQ